MLARDHVCDHS